MKISEFYKKQKHTFSFEFFPPKTPEGELQLFQTVERLKEYAPSFISVTYGAMGSTRAGTLEIVERIKKEAKIEAAAHLTCVGHTKSEIEAILRNLKASGIENLVALRGDQPKGNAFSGDFKYAADLVGYIRGHEDFKDHFSIAVGGYPACPPECADPAQDLLPLTAKVKEGADVVITQLFFDNDDYFRFVDEAKKIGIEVPIVPGIMPITNAGQIEKFSQMCGAKIPGKIKEAIKKLGDDVAAVTEFGTDYASLQCENLLNRGAPGLHFYTLNKSQATAKIYERLHLEKK